MKAEGARSNLLCVCSVKDHILSLNGETVTDDHDGVAKLKAAPDGDVTFVVSRPVCGRPVLACRARVGPRRKLRKHQRSRARAAQDENGILRTEVRTAFAGTHTIKWVSETKVELTDKNNQAVILACCCPGCVQNFSARHPARA